jgi:hypothetical protein
MITAYGDAETLRRDLENGAEALLTKPILWDSAAKWICASTRLRIVKSE